MTSTTAELQKLDLEIKRLNETARKMEKINGKLAELIQRFERATEAVDTANNKPLSVKPDIRRVERDSEVEEGVVEDSKEFEKDVAKALGRILQCNDSGPEEEK